MPTERVSMRRIRDVQRLKHPRTAQHPVGSPARDQTRTGFHTRVFTDGFSHGPGGFAMPVTVPLG